MTGRVPDQSHKLNDTGSSPVSATKIKTRINLLDKDCRKGDFKKEMEIIYDNWDNSMTLVEKRRRCFNVVQFIKQKDGMYKYITADININSSLIDKNEIETYAGMLDDFSPEEFAACCLEYYGSRFWNGKVGYFTKEESENKIDEMLMGATE